VLHYFRLPKQYQEFILNHIVEKIKSESSEIYAYDKFSYLKFKGMSHRLKSINENDFYYIHLIPSYPFETHYKFGSTIHDQIWKHRIYYPNLPIPCAIYLLVKTCVEKQAHLQTGIFRIEGSIKKVQNIEEDFNRKIVSFQQLSVNDLIFLLKRRT
jgi:hypothetical protein